MYFFMKYGLLTKTKSKPALIYIYYITFKKSYIIHTFIEGGIFILSKFTSKYYAEIEGRLLGRKNSS